MGWVRGERTSARVNKSYEPRGYVRRAEVNGKYQYTGIRDDTGTDVPCQNSPLELNRDDEMWT